MGSRSELPVSARTGREAPRARLALTGIRGGLAERELVGHRLAQGEPDALPGGAAIALLVAAALAVEQIVRLAALRRGPAASVLRFFVRPFVRKLL